MKSLLRHFLINMVALYFTTYILPGLTFSGGLRTLVIGSFGLMLINMSIVPLLKIMFLPLNLLTLGLFTWIINVIALYFLTTLVPQFKLLPYSFPGANISGVLIPAMDLRILHVAILASFLIGLISHFMEWLTKS